MSNYVVPTAEKLSGSFLIFVFYRPNPVLWLSIKFKPATGCFVTK